MQRLILVAFWCLNCLQVAAQTTPPSTDIYLVDLDHEEVNISLEGPINITNRDGYDNQPFFSPDGRFLLFTSFRDGQTDIYQFSLSSGSIERLTKTPESEYSPTVTPDAAGISVIRVEADGTQRLWLFDRDGSNPALLFEDVSPVGYHAWIDDEQIAMFILGDPPTLHIGALALGSATVAVTSIGRSLHRIPGSKSISFVHKQSESNWLIRQLDASSGVIEDISPTLSGREDYAWTPEGDIVMANEAILYRWEKEEEEWKAIYDFKPHDIVTITRLAVSPNGDKLAFVAGR